MTPQMQIDIRSQLTVALSAHQNLMDAIQGNEEALFQAGVIQAALIAIVKVLPRDT